MQRQVVQIVRVLLIVVIVFEADSGAALLDQLRQDLAPTCTGLVTLDAAQILARVVAGDRTIAQDHRPAVPLEERQGPLVDVRRGVVAGARPLAVSCGSSTASIDRRMSEPPCNSPRGTRIRTGTLCTAPVPRMKAASG